jgi:ribose transport system substrate-binding protein
MRKLACFILAAAVSFAGCSSDTGIETTADDAGGTIGYSAMSFKNPFFVVIKENLEDAARAAGYELIANDADSDVSKQANHIDEFINKGVSAIVLNPTDKLAIGEAIKKANEAGIPVFTCDLQCTAEGVEIAGHIGTDNYQGGTLAGEAMLEILGDQGGEVLVLDYKQANSCVLRVDGFMDVINKHNEGEQGKITIVAEVNGGGDEDIGYKATTDILIANPNITGIFAINDPSALGAWKAIDEAGKTEQITIVGFDGAKAGKQAILEGKIYADPIQYPVRMGREIMAKILAYQNGEDFEAVELIPTTLYRKADAEMDPELQQ